MLWWSAVTWSQSELWRELFKRADSHAANPAVFCCWFTRTYFLKACFRFCLAPLETPGRPRSSDPLRVSFPVNTAAADVQLLPVFTPYFQDGGIATGHTSSLTSGDSYCLSWVRIFKWIQVSLQKNEALRCFTFVVAMSQPLINWMSLNKPKRVSATAKRGILRDTSVTAG